MVAKHFRVNITVDIGVHMFEIAAIVNTLIYKPQKLIYTLCVVYVEYLLLATNSFCAH